MDHRILICDVTTTISPRPAQRPGRGTFIPGGSSYAYEDPETAADSAAGSAAGRLRHERPGGRSGAGAYPGAQGVQRCDHRSGPEEAGGDAGPAHGGSERQHLLCRDDGLGRGASGGQGHLYRSPARRDRGAQRYRGPGSERLQRRSDEGYLGAAGLSAPAAAAAPGGGTPGARDPGPAALRSSPWGGRV